MPSDDLLLLVLNDMTDSSKIRRELKFEGYSEDDVHSCFVYAIEKGLIEGKIFRPISGKITPLPQRLTAYGYDFISSLQSKKREASAVQNATTNPSADTANRPMNPMSTLHIKILETVAGGLVLACAIYLIYTHFGLKLN